MPTTRRWQRSCPNLYAELLSVAATLQTQAELFKTSNSPAVMKPPPYRNQIVSLSSGVPIVTG
jgi:hypothetical protein